MPEDNAHKFSGIEFQHSSNTGPPGATGQHGNRGSLWCRRVRGGLCGEWRRVDYPRSVHQATELVLDMLTGTTSFVSVELDKDA